MALPDFFHPDDITKDDFLLIKENADMYFKMGNNHKFSINNNKRDVQVNSVFSHFSFESNLELLIRKGNELKKEGKYKEAFVYIKQAADLGNPESQFDIGCCYDYGKGVEKDLKQASYYYQLAADQGNDAAQNNLACCYQHGSGIEKDLVKAVYYYNMATEQNNLIAMCNLADCYRDGEGVEKSKEEAFKLYKKAADQYFPKGQYEVGNCYEWGLGVEISRKKAIEYYRLALAQKYKVDEVIRRIDRCEDEINKYEKLQIKSDKGDAQAQYKLGNTFHFGRLGIKEDESKAVHYYTLAAAQENLEAIEMLFRIYYEGYKVEKSLKKALHYLKILADHDDPEFICYLGEFYEKGYGGLNQSYHDAFKCYKQAAEHGHARSQYIIGQYFKKGLFVESSSEDAFKHTKIAADKGVPIAEYEVAEMFRLGFGTEQSDKNALDYYKRASRCVPLAQDALINNYHYGSQPGQPYEETLIKIREMGLNGSPSFQFEIGRDFAEGKNGLKQSDENAFFYYKLAADQGHPEGQFKVGNAYRNGKGTEKSDEFALEYLQKAGLKGNTDACNILARYYQYGIDPNQPYEDTLKYIGDLAAQAQSSSFIYELGVNFENGCNGVKKSYEEAFKYFKKAYDKYPESSKNPFAVGLYYKMGWGVEQSDVTALNYFMHAADEGHARALYYLGEAYRTGKGVEQSNELAQKYYKRAAKKENMEACAALAQHYRYLVEREREYLIDERSFEKTDQASYEEVLKYLDNLATNGNPTFQHNLGVYFDKGVNGLEKSYGEAFKYFNMAANKGYALSQCAVAIYYKNGWSIEKSDENAFKYFKLSADQGEATAQDHLAECYKQGWGTHKSDELAFKYYKISAVQGNSAIQNKVGYCYQYGRGVEIDLVKAIEYYQMAADQGNRCALFNLGHCYANGKGVEQSQEKAFKFFKQSADLGFNPAQNSVANRYYNGKGVAKDYVKAFEYYKLASDQGNAIALYQLGRIYENGDLGINPSWEKALKYYIFAAERGHVDAARVLGNCYHYGYHELLSEKEAAKYYQIGAKRGDPDCLEKLGSYYLNLKGNLKCNFLEALNYTKLAASKGNIKARARLSFFTKMIHPHAHPVDLTNYLNDLQLSTFQSILESFEKKPMFLSDFHFDWAEAQIIRDAMVANSHFTVICSESEFERLRHAFELNGYDRENDLKWEVIGRYSKYENLYACVFLQQKK